MQCLHASVCVGIKQFIYTVLYRERARILIFCIETHVRASHFAVLQRSRVRTSHHLNIPDDVCAYARTKSQHAGTYAYARTISQHAGTCVRMHVQYLNMLARCVNSLVMSRDYVGSCCCFRILLLKRANQQFSI